VSQPQAPQIKFKAEWGEATIEIVKIEKRYNVDPEDIPTQIARYTFFIVGRIMKVLVYRYDTGGPCRELKSYVLNSDGSYIPEGKWIDNSSRKQIHRYKVMDLQQFLEKYRGKELVVYVRESRSCNNKSSFRAVVRIL
jgi:hypothetical protein